MIMKKPENITKSIDFTTLRLERGGGPRILLSCACFLITQLFLITYRLAIHGENSERT